MVVTGECSSASGNPGSKSSSGSHGGLGWGSLDVLMVLAVIVVERVIVDVIVAMKVVVAMVVVVVLAAAVFLEMVVKVVERVVMLVVIMGERDRRHPVEWR